MVKTLLAFYYNKIHRKRGREKEIVHGENYVNAFVFQYTIGNFWPTNQMECGRGVSISTKYTQCTMFIV